MVIPIQVAGVSRPAGLPAEPRAGPHAQRPGRGAEHLRRLSWPEAGDVDQFHRAAVGLRQGGEGAEEAPAGPFGVNAGFQLLDVVGGEVTPAGETAGLVVLAGAGLAVRRIHAPGDAEHPRALCPCPGRTCPWR